MTSLTKQLQSAEAGSRELDQAILERFDLVMQSGPDPVVGPEPINFLDGNIYSHPARVTTSIDAALALVKEVLPDVVWTVSSNENGYAATLYELVLEKNNVQRKVMGQLSVSFASPAIALVLALLSAAAVEGSDG